MSRLHSPVSRPPPASPPFISAARASPLLISACFFCYNSSPSDPYLGPPLRAPLAPVRCYPSTLLPPHAWPSPRPTFALFSPRGGRSSSHQPRAINTSPSADPRPFHARGVPLPDAATAILDPGPPPGTPHLQLPLPVHPYTVPLVLSLFRAHRVSSTALEFRVPTLPDYCTYSPLPEPPFFFVATIPESADQPTAAPSTTIKPRSVRSSESACRTMDGTLPLTRTACLSLSRNVHVSGHHVRSSRLGLPR